MAKIPNITLKRSFIVVAACLLAMLLCTSCRKEYSIVGKWQIVGATYDDGTRIELETTDVYEFRDNSDLIITSIADGDTTVEANNGWEMHSDTLIMYKRRQPGEEPGMPGAMLVEKLTKSEMRWLFLILGDMYIDLKRI